jgi:hypothetical protein
MEGAKSTGLMFLVLTGNTLDVLAFQVDVDVLRRARHHNSRCFPATGRQRLLRHVFYHLHGRVRALWLQSRCVLDGYL